MEIKEKLKIPYPILVEGKYDRLRLLSVLDANIITTDGFGIFNKKEKTALLRALARTGQIIVLTDSDGAGKLIRSHVSGCLPRESIINLYTPEIFGKEKRKAEPSAEGKLGVEGMERELLYNLFLPYTDGKAGERGLENPISKTDFYEDGLSGGKDSAAKRDALAIKLGLPTGMTANALLSAIKMICTYDEYLSAVGRARSE
jgi:ribonuclease M5